MTALILGFPPRLAPLPVRPSHTLSAVAAAAECLCAYRRAHPRCRKSSAPAGRPQTQQSAMKKARIIT